VPIGRIKKCLIKNCRIKNFRKKQRPILPDSLPLFSAICHWHTKAYGKWGFLILL